MKKLGILIMMILLVGGCGLKRLKIEGEVSKSPIITPFYDKYWILLEDLTFEFHRENSIKKYQITVPAGFVTDLASVPPGINSIFDHYGRYATAAIIHDYLYWVQSCKREFADHIFRDVLKTYEVPIKDRFVMWGGLTMGGNKPWIDNKKLRHKGDSRFVPLGYRKRISPDKKWSVFKKTCCLVQADWEKVETKPEYCSIVDENAG